MGLIQPTWRASESTHTGNVRDHNEDALLNLSEEQLWVIADGMGGHSAGDLASRLIVESLKSFKRCGLLGEDVRDIRRRLQSVNNQLLNRAGPDEQSIIGATVAAFLIDDGHAVALWAGDSRIYRYREGSFKQITRDHNETEALLDQGVTLEEAERSPYAQSVTRAVGATQMLHLESQIIEIHESDLFLLCTDGLNKEIPDNEIARALSSFPPKESVRYLLKTALCRKGQDNITIMIVHGAPDTASSESPH